MRKRPAVRPSQNADVAHEAVVADSPSAARWLGSQPPTPSSTPTYSAYATANSPTIGATPRPPVRPRVDEPLPSVGVPWPRTRLSGTARADREHGAADVHRADPVRRDRGDDDGPGHRADAEHAVEDVEHRPRPDPEAVREQLVDAQVEGPEADAGEPRAGEDGQPGRRDREQDEAGDQDGHRQDQERAIRHEPERLRGGDDADERAHGMGAEQRRGGRRPETEADLEDRDERSVERGERADEDERQARGDDGRPAEHRCLGQWLDGRSATRRDGLRHRSILPARLALEAPVS